MYNENRLFKHMHATVYDVMYSENIYFFIQTFNLEFSHLQRIFK